MSKGAAQQMVVVSMLVTAAVVGYDVIAHGTDAGDPSAFKTVWALGVLFLLLAVTADIVPELAGPFAGLVMLAVLVGRGGAVKQIVSVVPSAGGAQK
jgi:hypothetical protein